LADAQRVQDLFADLDLFDRIRRERDPDRVADAFGQQRPDADRRFRDALLWRAGFGNAQMERHVRLIGEQTVRVDHLGHVLVLDRDLDVAEAVLLEEADLVQSALDESLGGRPSVLLDQLLVERSRVHADTDRDLLLARRICNLFDVLGVAHVARIQAQTVDAGVDSHQCQPNGEMDVGDDRHATLLHDRRQGFGIALVGHRDADDVGALCGKRMDLDERGIYIIGLGRRHRLDRYRRIAADGYRPDVYAASLPTFVHQREILIGRKISR
jgi:hypothetical protein